MEQQEIQFLEKVFGLEPGPSVSKATIITTRPSCPVAPDLWMQYLNSIDTTSSLAMQSCASSIYRSIVNNDATDCTAFEGPSFTTM